MSKDMPETVWLEPDGDEILFVTDPEIFNHPERYVWQDGTPMIQQYTRTDIHTRALEVMDKMAEALKRSEIKHKAYIGICDGDKELNEAIIPVIREALEEYQKRREDDVHA